MPTYSVAGVGLRIDAPSWLLPDSFRAFEAPGGPEDVSFRVLFQRPPELAADARLILAGRPARIYQSVRGLDIRYPDLSDVPCGVFAGEDWLSFALYVDPDQYGERDAEVLRLGLLPELRQVFGAALSLRRGFLVHSATIEWRGKAVVFSAVSGTGKSTHAHLWQAHYGVPILDGDVCAVTVSGAGPTAWGLPWCGSSDEYLSASAPLGAVVFLKQAPANSIRRLGAVEAVSRLAARSFLPLLWSPSLVERALDAVQDAVSAVSCYELCCLPNFEAVELVRQCLET